jgi:polyisoprenoid-binding protein YceI
MNKIVKTIGKLVLIIGIAILVGQCNKDEGVKYSKLTGKVSLEDGTVAGGAIVSISKEPNAADLVANTVADADGNYSFVNIENGTYYVNARYEPSNNNNTLKSAGTVVLTGAEAEVSLSGDKAVDIVLTGVASTGTGVISYANGWKNDNVHSVVEFEFPYDAVNAVFTGHFARVGVDTFEFDEQHPENTVLKAWVDITSVETGAASPPGGHGRDGMTGCIAGTLKVSKDAADTIDAYSPTGDLITSWPNDDLEAFDLWGNGSHTKYTKQSAIIGASGVATIEAKEVTAYGNGYVATCDFTFAGVTKSVKLYFSYTEGYEKEDKNAHLIKYTSIYGWFSFAAAADFSIVSGHIGDNDVTVKLSVQFNKDITPA